MIVDDSWAGGSMIDVLTSPALRSPPRRRASPPVTALILFSLVLPPWRFEMSARTLVSTSVCWPAILVAPDMVRG